DLHYLISFLSPPQTLSLSQEKKTRGGDEAGQEEGVVVVSGGRGRRRHGVGEVGAASRVISPHLHDVVLRPLRCRLHALWRCFFHWRSRCCRHRGLSPPPSRSSPRSPSSLPAAPAASLPVSAGGNSSAATEAEEAGGLLLSILILGTLGIRYLVPLVPSDTFGTWYQAST
ncbi:Os06g0518100, partial [Oryza sativa Japonica Group]